MSVTQEDQAQEATVDHQTMDILDDLFDDDSKVCKKRPPRRSR